MTRWIAAGAIGAAIAAGVANGIHHGHDAPLATSPLVSRDINDAGTQQREPSPPPEIPPPALDDTLTITGEHEAGHVAAARELGIPVQHVEISPDGSGETAWPDHYYRDPARDAYDAAVIDVAGQESAAAWLEQHRGYSLERALSETRDAARSDLAQLQTDTAQAGISETQARQRARDIIGNHRAEIDQLAQRLADRGSLNEWELER